MRQKGMDRHRTTTVKLAKVPTLLGTVRKARQRLLWVVAPPDYLNESANAPLWDSFKPTVLFVSEGQQRAYGGPLPKRVLAPGAGAAFYEPPPVYAPPDYGMA